MDNSLFRKNSLEHISSPEELHDYMRVTSPKLWMILAATIALLAGFIVYASMATMENTMDISVDVQSFETTAEYQAQSGNRMYSVVSSRLPMSQLDLVETGMVVRVGKEEGKVSFISTIEEDREISLVIEMDHGFLPLPDGTYNAELVLESTTPINFLWN